MERFDLNAYSEWGKQRSKTIVITVKIRLDKATMIDLLSKDAVTIHGFVCKVPEKQILHLLLNEKYGSTILDLEVIEDEQ